MPGAAVRTAALILTTGTGAFAASMLETINREVSSIYEKSRESIVKIHAQRQLQIGNLPLVPSHRIGTGFFIDGQGRILTAATVVEDADSCWIEWHGQRLTARVLGRDPQTNLAVLQVDPNQCAPADGKTPALDAGNSDELRIGSMVIAIGFPYDLPSAPAVGFVSGFDIQRGPRMFVTTHIRAGCRLSPGQGGAPLLNVQGQVVGIAVAAHMEDQCYALPINAAKKIYADILQSGQPQYGWVGLGVSERQLGQSADHSGPWQVFVQQVFSNTPAAEAGFRDQDVLLRIATNEVRRSADVLNKMFHYRAGDTVTFTVLRDGKEQQITLKVGTRPAAESLAARPLPPLLPLQPQGPLPQMVPASQQR